MSISRRGNSYRVTLTHQGQQYRTSTTDPTEARALELEGQARLIRGEEPFPKASLQSPSGPRLVADMFNLSYSRRWAGSKGERTAVPNAEAVLQLLGRDLRVSALKQSDINRVFDELRGKSLAGATINRKMSCLQAMLTDAFEDGWISKKLKVQRAKVAAKKRRELQPKELFHLCSLLEDQKHRYLLEFLMCTGCRVGEALKVSCGEWVNQVEIADSKGGEGRTIPLTYKASYAVWQGELDTINQDAFNRDWRQAREKASLASDVTPHCLRHTCASRLVRAGVDLITVQRWMGWSSPAMLNDYVHLMPDQTAKAVQALEAYSER